MTFLAMASQRSLFTLQRSQLNFEWAVLMSRSNVITSEMAEYAKNAPDNDEYSLDEDPMYIEMERISEYLQLEADSLKSQIDVLEQEISSLKTTVTEGIKSTCSLHLVNGG